MHLRRLAAIVLVAWLALIPANPLAWELPKVPKVPKLPTNLVPGPLGKWLDIYKRYKARFDEIEKALARLPVAERNAIKLDHKSELKDFHKLSYVALNELAHDKLTPETCEDLRLLETLGRQEQQHTTEMVYALNSVGVALACVGEDSSATRYLAAARAHALHSRVPRLAYASILFNMSVVAHRGRPWRGLTDLQLIDSTRKIFRSDAPTDPAYGIVLGAYRGFHESSDDGIQDSANVAAEEGRLRRLKARRQSLAWPKAIDTQSAGNGGVFLVPDESQQGRRVHWHAINLDSSGVLPEKGLSGFMARRATGMLGNLNPRVQYRKVRALARGFRPDRNRSLMEVALGVNLQALQSNEYLDEFTYSTSIYQPDSALTREVLGEVPDWKSALVDTSMFSQLRVQADSMTAAWMASHQAEIDSVNARWAFMLDSISVANAAEMEKMRERAIRGVADSLLDGASESRDMLVISPGMNAGQIEFDIPDGLSDPKIAGAFWNSVEARRTTAVAGFVAMRRAAELGIAGVAEVRSGIGRANRDFWTLQAYEARFFKGQEELDAATGGDTAVVRVNMDSVDVRSRRYAAARADIQYRSMALYRSFVQVPWSTSGMQRWTWGDAGHDLPDGTVFVSFVGGKKRAAVLLLSRRVGARGAAAPVTLLAAYLEGSPEQWITKVKDFQDLAFGSRARERAIGAEGKRLFEALFPTPALRTAIRNAKRVVISPGAPLADMPFALLVGSAKADSSRFLGLEKPLSYSESYGLLEYSRRSFKPSGETGTLVAGAPDLHGVMGELLDFVPLRSLPGAEVEAKAIATRFGAQPLLGGSATESAVRGRLPGSANVHLATHGIELSDDVNPPLAAGVFLAAGDCREGDATRCNGAFQAFEALTELDLDSQCMALSGCQTGRVWFGYGNLGEFVRSLVYAGARSVYCNQWRVDDRAAERMIGLLYGKLRRGVAKDEALRATMQEMAADPSYRHPYYWASTRLVGSSGALAQGPTGVPASGVGH